MRSRLGWRGYMGRGCGRDGMMSRCLVYTWRFVYFGRYTDLLKWLLIKYYGGILFTFAHCTYLSEPFCLWCCCLDALCFIFTIISPQAPVSLHQFILKNSVSFNPKPVLFPASSILHPVHHPPYVRRIHPIDLLLRNHPSRAARDEKREGVYSLSRKSCSKDSLPVLEPRGAVIVIVFN